MKLGFWWKFINSTHNIFGFCYVKKLFHCIIMHSVTNSENAFAQWMHAKSMKCSALFCIICGLSERWAQRFQFHYLCILLGYRKGRRRKYCCQHRMMIKCQPIQLSIWKAQKEKSTVCIIVGAATDRTIAFSVHSISMHLLSSSPIAPVCRQVANNLCQHLISIWTARQRAQQTE